MHWESRLSLRQPPGLLNTITSDTRVLADSLVVPLPRGRLQTDQQSTLLEREGEVGSCKHRVSTCRARCDMKSRCWYATADWLPRDGERNTKALCIDVRLCSTRPWLNPMSRYLTKMPAWAAVSMRGSTGLGCVRTVAASSFDQRPKRDDIGIQRHGPVTAQR